MIARSFIDRPVTASVLSLLVVLVGLASLRALPVAQYPSIVPPQIYVQANYPGADAETLSQTVAAPLERAINGVDGMIYMQSQNSAGQTALSVSFEVGTDPEIDSINVSNRVQGVVSSLPQETQRLGVTVQKQSGALVTILALVATSDRYDDVAISNYALRNVIDELKRVPGISNAEFFGKKDYSMRVWLRPDKLAQFRLTASDVSAALAEQNQEFATGSVNGAPGDSGPFTYAMVARGRLDSVAAFGDVILREAPDGSALRLRDVARIELGSEDYTFNALQDGRKTVPIGIFLKPGANALVAAAAVQARTAELARQFPDGIGYSFPYDTTKFVRASIAEVLRTFALALALVVGVTFLFLQSWRATLIPLVAVPVSIIGSFAGLKLLGFSINLVTLFGLILAIGIVVDDAIVVLENIERLMHEHRMTPRQAAIRAMEEVSGPVVAIVLVLCAVFVPVAFLGGLTGQLYRQFAAAIVVSVVISGVVALTLTPALCVAVLRPRDAEPPRAFRWFNRGFAACGSATVAVAAVFVRRRWLAGLALAAICAACAVLAVRVPAGLVPDEDQANVLVGWALPPAASLARTTAVMGQAADILKGLPYVKSSTMFAGNDLLTNANRPDSGVAYLTLSDWSRRTAPGMDARTLSGRIREALSALPEARFSAFTPPGINGLGQIGGFEAHLLDREGHGTAALMQVASQFVAAAARRPELAETATGLQANTPRYAVELDRDRAKALGVSISAVFDTVQATFGSLYVNDFTLYGHNYHVNLQSDAQFRRDPDDIRQVFVRAAGGEMVPLSSVLHLRRTVGADAIERFNVYQSAQVTGRAAPGYSSGQAIAAMEDLAATELPAGYGLAWAGAAYQEKTVGAAGLQAAGLGIVVVFLILAALYERWTLPLAVLLVVPLALFGALLAVWLRGMEDDIYFQAGLITLVGLSAKNSVLIVEFAARRQREGATPAEAALTALRLRFRPIVMTSLAFILGCLPLALSVGAGAGARRSIGTGVIGGMLGATVLALFLVPAFYRIVAGWSRRGRKPVLASTKSEQ